VWVSLLVLVTWALVAWALVTWALVAWALVAWALVAWALVAWALVTWTFVAWTFVAWALMTRVFVVRALLQLSLRRGDSRVEVGSSRSWWGWWGMNGRWVCGGWSGCWDVDRWPGTRRLGDSRVVVGTGWALWLWRRLDGRIETLHSPLPLREDQGLLLQPKWVLLVSLWEDEGLMLLLLLDGTLWEHKALLLLHILKPILG
jgi:hypothetical protein